MAITIDAKLASRLRATEPHVFEAIRKRGEDTQATRGRNEDYFIVPDENGQPLLAIKMHNLWQAEYEALDRKHRQPIRDEASGVEIPGPLNRDRYQSEIIHDATDPEDRKALWDNPQIRAAYGVQSNLDVIERILGGPGVKALAINFIDRLGRYGVQELTQRDLEKLLGNSSGPEGEPQSSTESTSETRSSPGRPSESSGSTPQ